MPKEIRKVHEVYAKVGDRIRQLRRIRQISAEQLAYSLSLTVNTVRAYERGGTPIPVSKVYAIAEILDYPLQTFFDGIYPEWENYFAEIEQPANANI